jgi:uncharacterized membrane protein
MKSTVLWVIAIVLIVVLVVALPLLFRFTGLGGYGGMMGRGGMMGGYFFPFGFLWMGIMLIVPLTVLVLVIAGGVALGNSLTRTDRPAPPPVLTTPAVTSGRTCGNCGKPAQADWNTCPYCGNALS